MWHRRLNGYGASHHARSFICFIDDVARSGWRLWAHDAAAASIERQFTTTCRVAMHFLFQSRALNVRTTRRRVANCRSPQLLSRSGRLAGAVRILLGCYCVVGSERLPDQTACMERALQIYWGRWYYDRNRRQQSAAKLLQAHQPAEMTTRDCATK